MAAISFSTIRSRFATEVATLTGFTVSRNPLDPALRLPDTLAHLRFAVGIGGAIAREDSRQGASVGAFMETTVEVRFSYRLRPKDQVADYDSAFDKAELIIKKILDRTLALYQDLHIRLNRMIHRITDSGEFMIITIEFACLHHIPIT